MADCLNNEEAINSQLSSTNTDAVSSNLDVDNGVSSELVGSNDMTSSIEGEETTTALLNEEEPLDSVLDQPTTAKYNGGETDNIVVSVDNSTHTITATLKPIKFKTVADFPVVGSDRLLYIDATENSLYSWDSDIGEYRKLVADTGDIEIDLDDYYTKTETEGIASQTLSSAKSYTDTKVAELIDSAPETLDTFKEIADAFAEHEEVVDALNSAIGNKVDKVEGKGLSTNDYTTEEKTKLAGIEAGATKTVVDDAFSVISTNPVQNKLVTEKLNEKVNKTSNETIGGVKTFSSQPVIADDVTESWQARGIVSADAIRKFLRENYQEILIAGNNITFDGNTISANLEGSSPIVTLTSPVVIYDLPAGVYQLPTNCELYINSEYQNDGYAVNYDNKSVALMVVNTMKTTSGTDDRLFYLFAEQDGVGTDTVGNSGSFIVGKAKQSLGTYHVVGTDIKYVTQETDGYINGNKSFVNPVKYYNQYESLATSLNDRTLVDAQWVKSQGYLNESDLAGKGYLTSIPSEYVTETELNNKGYLTGVPSEYVTESELTAKGYATQSGLNSTNSNVSSVADNVASLNTKVNTLNSTVSSLSSNKLNTSDLLNKVYPVGSVYMSVSNTSPASFIGGTWTQIGAGYALWTATSGAGGTISAGLPNITGSFAHQIRDGASSVYNNSSYNKGAFSTTATSLSGNMSWGTDISAIVLRSFNASGSNSIYGKSTTVQPPAYKVYAWRRTG